MFLVFLEKLVKGILFVVKNFVLLIFYFLALLSIEKKNGERKRWRRVR